VFRRRQFHRRLSALPQVIPGARNSVTKFAIDKWAARERKQWVMRKAAVFACLLPAGCAAKKPPAAAAPPPPPPIRSQMPPANAELIENCVVVKQENANTVTCSCLPLTTKIDSKTGHLTLVCKKMKEEK